MSVLIETLKKVAMCFGNEAFIIITELQALNWYQKIQCSLMI